MHRRLALLFDLDGTLVDSAITIAAALTDLSLGRGGEPVDVARTRELVSQGASTLVRQTLGPLVRNEADDVAAFRAILAGIPAVPSMIFPGVIAALESLIEAGHSCAVVTNKPENLARLLLDQLDLRRLFSAVVGGDTLSLCKPHPEPLRHALDRMGTTEVPALMIGDSVVDARAAAATHIPFLLYEDGYEAAGCGRETVTASFARFEQLPRLVGEIAATARHGAASGSYVDHGQGSGRMIGNEPFSGG